MLTTPQMRLFTDSWLGVLSRALRPEAACYRPRRVPGGDGHTEPLPTARFLIWIGPLSLVQGLESAAGYLSPLWGPGVCRMLRDKAWSASGLDGLYRWRGLQAPPARFPDKASRLGIVGTPC